MKLKLKEDPREWQKFTAALATVAGALALLGWMRGALPPRPANVIFGVAGLALMLCAVRPRWFRGFYRGGMTVSFHIGQFMGKVLLTVFFCLALVPLAFLLRLSGKDPLRIRRDPQATSYWLPARSSEEFERMF